MVSLEMENVSSPEIAKIFKRLPRTLEVKGALSSDELERRMQDKVDLWRARANVAERSNVRIRNRRNAEQLEKLIENGFPARVLRIAMENRTGFIAQSLLYGRAEAKRRILAYRRQRIARAYPRVGVPPRTVIALPPPPETRRFKPWRRTGRKMPK